jgi:uncharacterized protein YprB with RNaseH-like and TPR domain
VRVENSFIPVRGVGEKTERALWRAGITHWDDFERAAVGPVTAERIASFVAVAREHLTAGDARFFAEVLPSGERWRLYENFRQEACFFDIETTGLDASHANATTVSVHRAGETATLVRGEDLTADALRRVFDDAALLVSYNGARFDVPFLEREFGLRIDRPHLDLMYPCRRLGLTGGLKAVEREVGIERDSTGLSGRDAIELWHAHERGEDGALDSLIAYNRDDTVNLRALGEIVAERLHEAVFETVRASGDDP